MDFDKTYSDEDVPDLVQGFQKRFNTKLYFTRDFRTKEVRIYKRQVDLIEQLGLTRDKVLNFVRKPWVHRKGLQFFTNENYQKVIAEPVAGLPKEFLKEYVVRLVTLQGLERLGYGEQGVKELSVYARRFDWAAIALQGIKLSIATEADVEKFGIDVTKMEGLRFAKYGLQDREFEYRVEEAQKHPAIYA